MTGPDSLWVLKHPQEKKNFNLNKNKFKKSIQKINSKKQNFVQIVSTTVLKPDKYSTKIQLVCTYF